MTPGIANGRITGEIPPTRLRDAWVKWANDRDFTKISGRRTWLLVRTALSFRNIDTDEHPSDIHGVQRAGGLCLAPRAALAQARPPRGTGVVRTPEGLKTAECEYP